MLSYQSLWVAKCCFLELGSDSVTTIVPFVEGQWKEHEYDNLGSRYSHIMFQNNRFCGFRTCLYCNVGLFENRIPQISCLVTTFLPIILSFWRILEGTVYALFFGASPHFHQFPTWEEYSCAVPMARLSLFGPLAPLLCCMVQSPVSGDGRGLPESRVVVDLFD